MKFMSLKRTINKRKENKSKQKHSFEWELIKELLNCNKKLTAIIYALLLLWFVTIYFLT